MGGCIHADMLDRGSNRVGGYARLLGFHGVSETPSHRLRVCAGPRLSGYASLPPLCLQDPRTAAKAEVEATMQSRQLMREELMIARYEVWGSVWGEWGGVPAADARGAHDREI